MSYRLSLLTSLILMAFISSTLAQDAGEDPRWNSPSSVQMKTNEPIPQVHANPDFRPNTTPRVVMTPYERLLVEPNIRPRPNTGYHQSEVNIATHPLNRNIMFGASHNITNVSPLKINVATFITSDGGQTWYGRDTLADFNTQRGDPAPIIDKNSVFIYGHLNSTTNFGGVTGMGMNRSTDNGWNFEPTINILNAGGSDADKNALGTDDNPTSPYYGNSYMAWTKFTAASFPATILVTRTTNSGVSWSDALQINSTAASNFSQGTDVATSPEGNVYVCWVQENNASPFASVFMGFGKSTDGGLTWNSNNTLYPTSGMRSSSFNGWAVRVSDFPRMAVHKSGGSRQGWIYIVSAEQNLAPAGSDADIVLHRSTDGGATWSAGIRVNQDPLNNGKKQFFPSICVDQGGGVNVAYYDNRDYASSGDSCEIYMSRSIDGGNTWVDVQVSDHAFRPKNVPGVNSMGDYMGITAGNGKVWPMWMDDRSGFYDVWTSGINVADPFDPNPPEDVAAFSDYSIPTSMRLSWVRPTSLVNGTPIGPYVIRIQRNGTQIAERPQTDSTFTDTGLTDGNLYTYVFQTRLLATDSLSSEQQAAWTAGGSRTPRGPSSLAVTGTQAAGYKIKWTNPTKQTDGTTLDDFAGIRLYRDGSLVATLTRASTDTARVDSTTDNPPAGFHSYYATAIDNENPVNESAPSNTGQTPIDLPLNEQFATLGAPNTNLWVGTNVDANDLGQNEPSAPYSLNLNGSPTSNADNIESRPIDLSAGAGAGIALAYLYQPGGTSDRPEVADSLIVEFQNNLGQWITVRKYPGIASTTPIPDYQFDAVGVDGVNPQGGTFFFNGFKFRFRSRGTTGTLDDDWFVDDVFFGIPSGTANIGASGVVIPTGQVSNNVALSPVIRVLNASAVQSGVFAVDVNITGPGTTYNGTQQDSNLAAGATRNISVSSQFTPNAVGLWTVRAWTRLTGDPNPANDTTVSTFFSVSPLTLPVQETFADSGVPNPLKWTNINGRVTADGSNEPSEPYALNLAGNGTGIGLDTVTSLTTNLSGMAGQGIALAYWQQPQGTGDVPETADSLATEALNDQGEWVTLRRLPGAVNRPFTFERINLDSVGAGSGSFFHSGFKFRFRSKATTSTTTRQDDWFVDDVFLGIPNGTPEMTVTPQQIVDTVLVGKIDSTRYSFIISNTNPFAGALNYTITESPAVTWLSVSPAAGGVPGGSSNPVRVMINFQGVVQGDYATQLIVSGNAPGNSSDTVSVSFRVNNAPIIGTTPAGFSFSINQGDSITGSLTIRNTGLGPLTYTTGINGGFAGDTATNIGSSQLNLTTTSLLLRGGVVGITRTVQLTEIKPYLTISTPVQLAFVVYENTAQTGTFTKIFERIATSETGTQFYSSGQMNLTLDAGKFYAVGVAWSSGLNYFWSTNIPVPVPTSFGSITGGLAATLSSFPPPATTNVTQTTSQYYTQIVTANGKWLNITTNGSGTVNPGDSTLLGFKVTTAGVQLGATSAALIVNSNDPVTPSDSTVVALTVITSVTERGSEIPLTYELSQNYPNPFNPSTKIEFALPEESIVRLKVYNILGQEIATIADEQRPAGYFVAEWNATNNFGQRVSSGVYFYKMEASSTHGENSFSSLKKMLILK